MVKMVIARPWHHKALHNDIALLPLEDVSRRMVLYQILQLLQPREDQSTHPA